jgi:polyisoprenoid-binding protein YceI
VSPRPPAVANWAAGLLVVGGAAQAATAWTPDAAVSRLEFVATQAGGEFDGRFTRFAPDVVFDPADLEASHLRVQVETASADTGDDQRDGALVGPDFFAAERWPLATFAADRFVPRGPDRFEAFGTLTIRGISKDVRLPFAFRPSADAATAEMTGGTTIHRLDFGVGQGEWRDTEWVGDEVRISFKLFLHRK